MTDNNTQWVTYPAKLKYAQVFEENMDTGEGESDAAATVRDREGCYSVFMCVSDQTKNKMIKDGFPEEGLGHQLFKPDDDFEGFPWAYRVKRYVKQKFKDQDGEWVRYGPPAVANLNEVYEDTLDDGRVVKKANPWTFEDGELGNGTFANVTCTLYKNKNKRIITLQKIGVKEHVPYEREELVYY